MTRRILWTIAAVFGVGLLWLVFSAPAQAGPGGGGSGGGTGGVGGTLVLTIPTKEILVPNQLVLGDSTQNYTLTFNSGTGQFSPSTAGPYTVAVTTHDSGRLQGYVITIQGFQKDGGQTADAVNLSNHLLASLNAAVGAKASAPPFPSFLPVYLSQKVAFYPYEMTFAGSLSQTEIASFANYLLSIGNTQADAYIGDSGCNLNNNGTYLCLKENATFTTTERGTTGPLYMLQSVPLGSIGALNVQGNVAAPGTISGFNFSNLTNAFAIGGTFPNSLPNASAQLSNYINQNSTKFSWTNVQPQLTSLFNKRTTGTTYTGSASYSSSTWNLNSTTADPTNAAKNSFSTPPEGKLWNVNNGLTFTGNVNFTGSGTIVTTGNVIFQGNVSCSPGTRLGILANGSITFSGSTIGCGAYTALNGNIQFLFSVSSGTPTANGIFIAQNSIILPTISGTGGYSIVYDSQFASNPTVLFQQLLQIVFSTSD